MEYNIKENVYQRVQSHFANTKNSYAERFKRAGNEILNNKDYLNNGELLQLNSFFNDQVKSYMSKLRNDNDGLLSDFHSVDERVKGRKDSVVEQAYNLNKTINNVISENPVAGVWETLNQTGTKYADRFAEAYNRLNELNNDGKLSEKQAKEVKRYVNTVFNNYETKRGNKPVTDYHKRVESQKQEIDDLLDDYIGQSSGVAETANSAGSGEGNTSALVVAGSKCLVSSDLEKAVQKPSESTTADTTNVGIKPVEAGHIDDYVDNINGEGCTPGKNAIMNKATRIKERVNDCKEKASQMYHGLGEKAYDSITRGAKKVSDLGSKLANYVNGESSQKKPDPMERERQRAHPYAKERVNQQMGSGEGSRRLRDRIGNTIRDTYTTHKEKIIGGMVTVVGAGIILASPVGLAGSNSSTNSTNETYATKVESTNASRPTNAAANKTGKNATGFGNKTTADSSSQVGAASQNASAKKNSDKAVVFSFEKVPEDFRSGIETSLWADIDGKNVEEIAGSRSLGPWLQYKSQNQPGNQLWETPSYNPVSINNLTKLAQTKESKFVDAEKAPEKISGISSWNQPEELEPALEKILENPSLLKKANAEAKEWFSLREKPTDDGFTYKESNIPKSLQEKVAMYGQNDKGTWSKLDNLKETPEQVALSLVKKTENGYNVQSVASVNNSVDAQTQEKTRVSQNEKEELDKANFQIDKLWVP